MRIGESRVLYVALVAALSTAAPSAAQVFGTFSWQMQPFCNRVTLTLTSVVPGFTLDGSDDQCGAATKGSITGIGVFNANGTVGLNFTIVASPSGQGVHVSAQVSPANGQGTWTDSSGNAGTFAFFAATPGLPARPLGTDPVDVAPNPNQATDICQGVPVQPTLIFCGSSAVRWTTGGFDIDGVQVWRDADGYVHIRGSARISTGTVGGAVFVLPPELRPRRVLGIPIATSSGNLSGTALLVIYPRTYPNIPGLVAVFAPSVSGHDIIHVGEISFRVDQ
ncbi:MAG: hypothetical protein AB7H93_04280 [Vicinamibacterales bacterium]